MKQVILDGRTFTSRQQTHEVLKEELTLPPYYGNNLDALWDALRTDDEQKILLIDYPDHIQTQLDWYGDRLLSLFNKVGQANRTLTVVFRYHF